MGIGAGANEKRVMTPGQQTLMCTLLNHREGLSEKRVLAEGGLSTEAPATVGAGENRHTGKGIESQMAKVGS